MLKYSFMKNYSNATREAAIRLLTKTDKRVLYTYGLRFRSPTTMDVPITKERALEIFNSNSLCDVNEHDDYIDLNAYSGADLW